MKPRSSRATTPSSQSVRGAAPMKTKQASASLGRLGAVGLADPQAAQAAVLALGGDRLRARADLDVGQLAICSMR